jgi:hypothetical protein
MNLLAFARYYQRTHRALYASERPRRRRFIYTLVVLTLFTVPNAPIFRGGLIG